MKIKYLFIAVMVLGMLGIGTAVLFITSFDPNAYKQYVVEKTKAATGRDLVLAGDISLSFFPWLGFSLHRAQLGNAPGFGATPMASVEKVEVRVALGPLVTGKVHVTTVKLHGAMINLQKNSQGVTNWDDLIKDTENTETQEPSSPAKALRAGVALQGVEISDAAVRWQDDQTGIDLQVTPLNLTIGEIVEGKPAPVHVDLKMKSATPAIDAALTLTTQALVNVAAQNLTLSDLQLMLIAKGDAFPAGELDVRMLTTLDVDVANEAIALTSLVISMQDTTLTGSASVQSFTAPQIKFSLASGKLDLDTLLPTSRAKEPADDIPARPAPIALPVEILRDLNVTGDIKVDILKVAGMSMSDVKTTLAAHNGVLQAMPVSMHLYGGTLQGRARIDVRTTPPTYALATDLTGVQIKPLSVDFLGKDQTYLRGSGNLWLDITTAGNTSEQLRRALRGNVKVRAGAGALHLRDQEFAANVKKAIAFVQGKEPEVGDIEVVFDKLSGTFTIFNGVADNRDVRLDTPLLFASGEGTLNIGRSKADYKLSIGLSAAQEFTVPITIEGTFDDLRYGIDLHTALKAQQALMLEANKEKLKKDLARKKAEKKEKLEKLKDKLKLF